VARSPAGPRPEPAANDPALSGPGQRPEPSPAGTRRRLQALAARAWSPGAIERESGVPARLIQRDLDKTANLPPWLARTVATAYDRLWNREPSTATAADRQAAAEASARAERDGWAPPMAWDDDLIDLPDAQPATGWRPRPTTRRKARDLVEDAEFVRKYGMRDANMYEIATRLGVKRDRLDQAYARARRYAARDAAGRAARADREAEAG
jgi:hypothetical protein